MLFPNIPSAMIKDSRGGLAEANVLKCYKQMVYDGASFWDVVQKSYLQRELNRSQVKAIIREGLQETKGGYKSLLDLFNISLKDHKKFLNFLHRNDLQPKADNIEAQ